MSAAPPSPPPVSILISSWHNGIAEILDILLTFVGDEEKTT